MTIIHRSKTTGTMYLRTRVAIIAENDRIASPLTFQELNVTGRAAEAFVMTEAHATVTDVIHNADESITITALTDPDYGYGWTRTYHKPASLYVAPRGI